MELTKAIKDSIDRCVLCWLATVSQKNIPNVSPKEIFTYYKKNKIIVANIASPQTVTNIKFEENVCISFIDILVQKGYQIKGKASIVDKTDPEFLAMTKILTQMTDGKYPFSTITKISVEQVKPIIAPSYLFYPDTKEEEKIKEAIITYGLKN